MYRRLIGAAAAAGALLAAAPALGQESCSRDELQAAVDSYIAAQTAGDASLLKAADGLAYKEQFAPADIAAGIVNTPLKIDFANTLLDESRCQTFTEIAVTDSAHPYMLGVHLTVTGGSISEIDSIVVDDDDWLFSAQLFADGVKDEDWGVIPEGQRDSRETIIAAVDPYFAMFKDVSIQPPWYEPGGCQRQEGGLRIPCALSAPLNVEFPDRNYVVDPAKGAVVALVAFGGRLPDSHLFRVEGGKVRYIHTITNCMGSFNCNFDLPEALLAERQARNGMLPPPKPEDAAVATGGREEP
jgi:hypothetical protein